MVTGPPRSWGARVLGFPPLLLAFSMVSGNHFTSLGLGSCWNGHDEGHPVALPGDCDGPGLVSLHGWNTGALTGRHNGNASSLSLGPEARDSGVAGLAGRCQGRTCSWWSLGSLLQNSSLLTALPCTCQRPHSPFYEDTSATGLRPPCSSVTSS